MKHIAVLFANVTEEFPSSLCQNENNEWNVAPPATFRNEQTMKPGHPLTLIKIFCGAREAGDKRRINRLSGWES